LASIVILSVPAFGHLNPVLPIAKELVRRGHSVTVFNEASFEPLIRATGANFVAYPPVIHLEDFARTLRNGDLVAWLEMIFLATGPLLGFCFKKLRAAPPDLIVFDGIALWGEMLATKLRVPSVSVSTTFLFEVFRELTSFKEFLRYELSVIPRLPGFAVGVLKMLVHGIRSLPWRLPLAPRQGSALTIMLTSKDVHPKTPLVEKRRFAFVGCSIEPSTRLEQFDFSRLDGRPLLYVSLGTLHHGNTAFFKRCIEAFGSYPGQVLLSVGRGTDLAQFAGAPDNFIIAEAVPQLDILKRASVFLTHAGLNSMHEGLWSGVPMVAVPQQFEQLRNSQVIMSSGAGLVLDSEVWGKPVTASALSAAVAALESDRDRYAAASARLGETLRNGGGYNEAANLVERAVAHHSGPVHAVGPIPPSTAHPSRYQPLNQTIAMLD
jgi:MGT family glycosyltransferase